MFKGPYPVVCGTPGVPTSTVVMVLFEESFFAVFFFFFCFVLPDKDI